MLFQRTLILFTAQEMQNSSPCIWSHKLLHAQNVLFDGSTLWSCRKTELRTRINFSPIHRCFTLPQSEGKSAIAKALNQQSISLGDKNVIVAHVQKLD
jgi:hypothetical protein